MGLAAGSIANYAQTKHEEFLGRWGSLYYDAVKNHFG